MANFKSLKEIDKKNKTCNNPKTKSLMVVNQFRSRNNVPEDIV